MHNLCGPFDTQYDGLKCPTCRSEREEAKRVIERSLGQDRLEKDRLTRDLEEWLKERGE